MIMLDSLVVALSLIVVLCTGKLNDMLKQVLDELRRPAFTAEHLVEPPVPAADQVDDEFVPPVPPPPTVPTAWAAPIDSSKYARVWRKHRDGTWGAAEWVRVGSDAYEKAAHGGENVRLGEDLQA